MNLLVLGFQFEFHDNTSAHVRASDPFMLFPSPGKTAPGLSTENDGPLTFLFRTLEFESIQPPSDGQHHKDHRIFFKSYLLGKDLSIAETLYGVLHGHGEIPFESNASRMGLPRHTQSPTASDIQDEHGSYFVVDDDDSSNSGEIGAVPFGHNEETDRQLEDFRRDWTINLESLYQIITQALNNKLTPSGASNRKPLHEMLAQTREQVEDATQTNIGFSLLCVVSFFP